jgi:hypothetical protein
LSRQENTQLKVFLVGSQIIPVKDWTSFWRRGRAALEKDPRVDASRAFEQRYRLAPEGADVADVSGPLPGLEARKPARTNLATLKKFLAASGRRLGTRAAVRPLSGAVDATPTPS